MLKKISSGPKKVSGNDTVETPFFPFWLVQKGDWERDKTVHAIFKVRDRVGVGWRGDEGGGSPLLVLEVIRLLLACPRGGGALSKGF